MSYMLVGAGGAIGSLLRYALGSVVLRSTLNSPFPYSTFSVNLLGCFAIGLIAGISERFGGVGAELRLFLITGVLGGFTTFSAFGFETFALLKEGNFSIALYYSLGSVVLGVLLLFLGFRLTT